MSTDGLQIRGGPHDGEIVEYRADETPLTTIRRTTADGATVVYNLFHATRKDFTSEWFYAPEGWPRIRGRKDR